jgi:hypothetical protein
MRHRLLRRHQLPAPQRSFIVMVAEDRGPGQRPIHNRRDGTPPGRRGVGCVLSENDVAGQRDQVRVLSVQYLGHEGNGAVVFRFPVLEVNIRKLDNRKCTIIPKM